jgi:hypothetical protein
VSQKNLAGTSQAPAPRETILSAVGMPAEHQVRTDQYLKNPKMHGCSPPEYINMHQRDQGL